MRGIRGIFVAFSFFGALAGTARTADAQASADSAGAHHAATAFLAAFDSLQWEPFRAYFADDVTMFFPFPDTPARADGRQAVEARFRTFFDDALAAWQRSGRPGAPRMGITPRDLRVQMAGDVAIVSFHLGAETPSRRSLVFRHTAADGWKLVHWHASPAPQRPAPAAATPAPAPAAPNPSN
jgi:ketosteroid isomerase-like protein